MDKLEIKTSLNRLSERVAGANQRKKKLQTEEARYTLVLHSARKSLKISINEYCLADAIHKLSSNRSTVAGWCYASKEHLGNTLGFSRQSIHSMINQLKKQDLIEVQEDTGYLRTTEAWREAVEVLKNRVFGDGE
jgi:CRP-like cAMP-binding protein